MQVWAKPQPHGAMAVLIINSDNAAPAHVQLQLSKLKMTTAVAVRDVWAHTDNGTIQEALVTEVPASDSQFFLLTPTPPTPAPTPVPTPTPTPSPARWSDPAYCTSCERSPSLKDLNAVSGLQECQAACERDNQCEYINFAGGDRHCILFTTCDDPAVRPEADCGGPHAWWTVYHLTRAWLA